MDESKEGFVIVTWSVPPFVEAEPDKPGMVALPLREGTFSSSQRIFINAKRELMGCDTSRSNIDDTAQMLDELVIEGG